MPTDSRTTARNYPRPSTDNTIAEDLARLITALNAIDTDVANLLNSVANRALLAHLHTIANVTGLQAALDSKAAIDHNHSIGSLTGVNLTGAANGQLLGLVAGVVQAITLAASQIPNLDAAKITSGTIDPGRLPALPSGNQVVSASATIAGLSTPNQDETVKGTIVTTTDGRRWVYSGSGSKVLEASYVELADVTPEWTVIANKPTTFAPSAHVHPISDVTGLQANLDALAAATGPTNAQFDQLRSTVSLLAMQTATAGRVFGDEHIIDTYSDTTGINPTASSGYSVRNGRIGAMGPVGSVSSFTPYASSTGGFASSVLARTRIYGDAIPSTHKWIRFRIWDENNAQSAPIFYRSEPAAISLTGTRVADGVGTATGSPPAAWRNANLHTNAAGTVGTWYGVDWGAGTPKTLNQIVLFVGDAQMTANFGDIIVEVRGSNDASTWTTLLPQTLVSGHAKVVYSRVPLNIENPTSFRYYEWRVLSTNTDTSLNLAEVAYYESALGLPHTPRLKPNAFSGPPLPATYYGGQRSIIIPNSGYQVWTDWMPLEPSRRAGDDVLVSAARYAGGQIGWIGSSANMNANYGYAFVGDVRFQPFFTSAGTEIYTRFDPAELNGPATGAFDVPGTTSYFVTGWETCENAFGVVAALPGIFESSGWTTYRDWRTTLPRPGFHHSMPTGITRMRFKFKAPYTNSLTIEDAFIGEQADSGSVWHFQATPTRITFNGGSNSVTMAPYTTATSDVISFTPSGLRNLLVSLKKNAISEITWVNTSTTDISGTWRSWYAPPGDRAGETVSLAPTGYTESSGTGRSAYLVGYEIVGPTSPNATVISTLTTADAVPTTGRIGLLVDTAGQTVTPGTNLRAWISRNGGTNETECTITLVQTLAGGISYYEGTASLTGQPSGTSMRWRYQLTTPINIDAVSVFWRP